MSKNNQTKIRKPDWLKIRPPKKDAFSHIRSGLKPLKLHTVCEEAHCPNMAECWSGGTATFMVLGDICTRSCKFCAIKTGNPKKQIDALEPINLAKSIKALNLGYAVITSVDRDDLEDGGAAHFAKCIQVAKESDPKLRIEVLIPDFRGDKKALKKVVDAKPDVIGHNVETTRTLQSKIRDLRANYEQSLKVLSDVKEMDSTIFTKSAIMLGIGERDEDVIQTMKDLREINVDIFTIGQYLQPSPKHFPLIEYVKPSKFASFKRTGEELGFKYVTSGPLVRSSYRAGELFITNLLNKKTQHA